MIEPQNEVLRLALRPASTLWALAAHVKNALYDRGLAPSTRLTVPVVSIGNITVGGTGKTPLVIHLARLLIEAGTRPLVLSRGYGSSGTGTRIVSDGSTVLLGPDEAGDEPVLVARSVPGLPVVVDPDRARGGREAILRFVPDLILLDDGFQHRRLARDLDVVLLDAIDPFGRYALLPSGLLREPLPGLRRAGVFVVTNAPEDEELATLTAVVRRFNTVAPILRARHVADRLVPIDHPPDPGADRSGGGSGASGGIEPGLRPLDKLLDPGNLRGLSVYAFCGIGNPRGFELTLQAAGAKIAGFERFPDHHRYLPQQIEQVAAAARAAGAAAVLTTEKDAVRIPRAPQSPPFYSIAIRMQLVPEQPLLSRILALTDAAAGTPIARIAP